MKFEKAILIIENAQTVKKKAELYKKNLNFVVMLFERNKQSVNIYIWGMYIW